MTTNLHQLSPARQKILHQYAQRRGILDSALDDYLHPHLHLEKLELPGTEFAVASIVQALRANKRIVAFGDYDCDGVTSTAILLNFFHRCTPLRLPWLLPDRRTDHYGLNIEKARQILAAEKPDLLITLDNGTNSGEAVQFLRENGVRTLVIDHHPPDGDVAATAFVMLNPKAHQPVKEDLAELCTAGLTLLFCHALAKALGCDRQWDSQSAIVLAGLGTLADACTLRGTNRAIVRTALQLINFPTVVGRSVGLSALLAEVSTTLVNQHSLQFGIIPRINAIGRLGSAEPAVELLTTRDPVSARRIAAIATETNTRRQELQQQVVDAANHQARAQLAKCPELNLLVLADAAWHHGVVGPAASRVVEQFSRSAILLGPDGAGGWKGSGRGHTGDDLGRFVRKLKADGLIERGGGHAAAVGLAVTIAQIEALQTLVSRVNMPRLENTEAQTEILADVDQLSPSEWQVVLEMLGPFGRGNPMPLLTTDRCLLETNPTNLTLSDGAVWAAKAQARTRKGQKLSLLWRDHATARARWKAGLLCDLKLELTWRPYNGRLFYNWVVVSSTLSQHAKLQRWPPLPFTG